MTVPPAGKSDVRARRETLLAPLRALRAADSPVPVVEVRRLAVAEGVDERTVYRWIERGLPLPQPPPDLANDLKVLLAECRGNVTRAHQRAVLELDYQHTRRHLARQYDRALSPADRAMLRDGEDGYRRLSVYLRWEAEHRNQIWEIDSWELPVWVRVKRGTRAFKPWAVVIVDAYSRSILSIRPIRGRPGQADVLIAIYEAVCNRVNAPFHGRPVLARWDKGMEFLGDVITELARNLDFRAQSVRAWSPFLKGKIERALLTIKMQFVSGLLGYLEGPRRENKTRFDAGGLAITLEDLAELLHVYVVTFNAEHHHSSLEGRTPLEAWVSDPTPLRDIDEAALRWMLPRRRRKITKHGVRDRNEWYFAPEFHGHVGKTVEVAYCPGDRHSVDIYRDGEWWATAVAQTQLTQAERRDALAERRAARCRIARDQRVSNTAPRTPNGTLCPRVARARRRLEAGKQRSPRPA